MRKFLNIAAAAALAAAAGCSSYSEIAYWKTNVKTNDGEVPMASFLTQNFSYQLFHCIPLATGRPWTHGAGFEKDDFDVKFFADEATVDNNLVSLKHALDNVGSHRITGLTNSEDDNSMWSLFLVNRHEVRTSCIILEPEPKPGDTQKTKHERK